MSALDYYDPKRQEDPAEHESCVEEDGELWFGHGMPCRKPEFHHEHGPFVGTPMGPACARCGKLESHL